MNKEVLKRIILENRDFLKQSVVYNRNYILEKEANYVMVGARRAGKTYLIYHHLITNFNLDNVLYINFEDERLIELQPSDLDLILQAYQELFTDKPVVFFDEIQNITGWEKFVRRLADTGYRVYITGSNAKFLSKEIASVLGGRFLIKEITPLSFSEYLSFNSYTIPENFVYSSSAISEIHKYFMEYLNYGGFPEVIRFTNKKEYLSNLYQKVFYGDILSRYSIKNEAALRLLVKKIAESVTNETSFNRFKNIITSIGINVGTATLIDYTSYLNDSFLIHSIGNLKNKFAEREVKRKFYFSDNGILNLFLIDQPQQLLENSVYVHLKRLYGDSVYYFQDNYETDFVISEPNLLFQVCLSFTSYDTRKREISSLKKAMIHTGLKMGTILTLNETELISDDGYEINVKPVWVWMLENNNTFN